MDTLRHEKQLLRWERRKLMYLTYIQGYDFTDFADEISKKYGLTPAALERDWGRRDKWIPILVEIQEPEVDIASSLMKLTAIQHAAWETYRAARKANNHNAMVGALEKLTRLAVREVEVKQSLGVLAKEPDRLDAMITTSGPMPWNDIPEVKVAVQKIRERLKAEKAANKEDESPEA